VSYLGNGMGTGSRALYLLAGLVLCGLLAETGSAVTAAVAPGSLDQSSGAGGRVLTALGVGGGGASDAAPPPTSSGRDGQADMPCVVP
jgi:hypothetical protein